MIIGICNAQREGEAEDERAVSAAASFPELTQVQANKM